MFGNENFKAKIIKIVNVILKTKTSKTAFWVCQYLHWPKSEGSLGKDKINIL